MRRFHYDTYAKAMDTLNVMCGEAPETQSQAENEMLRELNKFRSIHQDVVRQYRGMAERFHAMCSIDLPELTAEASYLHVEDAVKRQNELAETARQQLDDFRDAAIQKREEDRIRAKRAEEARALAAERRREAERKRKEEQELERKEQIRREVERASRSPLKKLLGIFIDK